MTSRTGLSLHFIGALTPEMMSLIQWCHQQGNRISASDDHSDLVYTPILHALGVQVFDMFAQTNISRTTDCVVVSRYYDTRHPEVVAAEKLLIRVVTETEFLKEIVGTQRLTALVDEYDGALTATWLSHVWQACHIPVNALAHTASAIAPVDLSCFSEQGEWIIPFSGFKRDSTTYEPDFLSFQPETVVVPSIRYDYPELHTTLDEVYLAYYTFARRIPRKGLIVGNNDYSRMKRLRSHLVDRQSQVYGLDRDAQWHIRDVSAENGETHFSLVHNRHNYGPFTIPAQGERFVYAAVAVCVLSLLRDINPASLVRALATVPLLKRYMEIRHDSQGRVIVLDRADHPELIKDVIATVRSRYPGKKIWCLYQPGSYLRTKALLPELVESLRPVDYLYLADIKGYPREKSEGLNVRHLIADLRREHNQVYYFESAEEMRHLLQDRVPSTDCILVLGAEGICQDAVAFDYPSAGV